MCSPVLNPCRAEVFFVVIVISLAGALAPQHSSCHSAEWAALLHPGCADAQPPQRGKPGLQMNAQALPSRPACAGESPFHVFQVLGNVGGQGRVRQGVHLDCDS